MTGYALSCISADVNVALTLTPVVVIPLMLFGGFYINQKFADSHISFVVPCVVDCVTGYSA